MARGEGRANICGSHEHHARSPDCAFFELCNRPESPIAKKAATKRKPRASTAKSTRLSMQSALEPEPSYLETPSFADDTIQDEGDSIATTASMPKGKGKKAPAAKGRKKKAEPVVEDDNKILNAPSEAEDAPAPPPKTAKGRKGKKVKEEPAPGAVEHNKSVMSAASGTLVVEEEPASKSRRGKKRISDSEADESIIAPAPKRRTRNSVAMKESIMPESSMHNTQDETSSSNPPPSKKATATKKKPARASRSRKVSEVSLAPESDNEPIDQLENELDRQLEDMDVENPSRTHSPEMLIPKPAMAPLGRKLRNSGGRLENNHHDMFNQMEVDEDEVDREMQQMEEEEQISKPLPKGKGKKGGERKVSVKQQVKEEKARRKAAEEQTRREQAEREAEELCLQQEAEVEELRLQQEAEEAEKLRLQEEAEAAEQLRLQRETEEAERLRIKEENAEKRRRSAKIKADAAERAHEAQLKAEQQRLEDERRQAEEEAEAKRLELEAEAEEERLRLEQEEEDERIRVEQEEEERQRLEQEAAAIRERIRKKNEAAAAAKAAKEEAATVAKVDKEEAATVAKAAKAAEVAAAKATKAKGKGKPKAKPKSPSPDHESSLARSPTPLESSVNSPSVLEKSTPVQPASARSANRSAISHRSQRSFRTLSPSASPQSSDAENHPPSSRPSSSIQASSARTTRQALGATTPKTPSRSLNRQPGGSKAGLHSEAPWEEVDLDTIFAHMRSPDKENASQALGSAVVGGELSEEERKMTVEEWIRYNAVKAEERLKGECEALVGMFEREGMRAVVSLEGVEVIEG